MMCKELLERLLPMAEYDPDATMSEKGKQLLTEARAYLAQPMTTCRELLEEMADEMALWRGNKPAGYVDKYERARAFQGCDAEVALRHIFVTAEGQIAFFPADGNWISVRDTAALALSSPAQGGKE